MLAAGDVLFVPQGHWHLAEPVGERTVHATLAINRPAGYEFVLWLQAVGMHQQVAMRRPLVTPSMQTAGADDSGSALAEQLGAWADQPTVGRFTVNWLANRRPRRETDNATARAFMAGDPEVQAVSACPGGFHLVAAPDSAHVWGGAKQLVTDPAGVELLARLSAPDGLLVGALEPADVEMVAALATAGLATLTRP